MARDEAHEAGSKADGLGRIVGDSELDEEFGPSHHSKTYLAGGARGALDLGERVAVGIDDVVEEVDAEAHGLSELVPVELPPVAHGSGHPAQVDASEVA